MISNAPSPGLCLGPIYIVFLKFAFLCLQPHKAPPSTTRSQNDSLLANPFTLLIPL
jgi:hypothetical protein